MNLPPAGDAFKRVGAYFSQLQVTQQPVPNLTVRIAPGSYYNGATVVEFAGGNSAAITLPGAGLAKWVLIALTGNAQVQVINGVPAVSAPAAPLVPGGMIPLAFVYVTASSASITQDMIFDQRPLWIISSAYLPLVGGTLTGPLVLAADPLVALGAATKQYVDTQVSTCVSLTTFNNGLATKADTDGTPSEDFKLNKDWVGAPASNVSVTVERGTQPDVSIRWNEGTDVWELTVDGSTYDPIATSGTLGSYLPLTGGTLTGPLVLAANPVLALGAATKSYVDTAIAGIGTTYVDVAGDTMTGVLVHPAGTAAVPAITFVGDLDTGFYSSGANEVSVAVNGAQKVKFSSAGVTVFSGFFTPGTGGVGAPEFAFTNDPTTGFYRVGAGQIGITVAGVNVATLTATGLSVTGNVAASGGLSVTGPATMNLDMGGFKVTNMAAPTLGADATTKTYVDTAGALKVNKADTLALTGDVTVPASALTGPANSFAATLAASGVVAATYGSASAVAVVTVDAKGRVTTAATTPILITEAQVTSLSADLTARVLRTDTFALTGDVTVPATALTGPANSYAATLANTAVTAGSYGSASSVGTFTVDAKGRLTAAASVSIAITGAAVTVGGFTLGHVVSLDAAGHPVDSGIASANLFLADGSVVATGAFDLGAHKVTNVASGTTAGDALEFGQIGTDVEAWSIELDGVAALVGTGVVVHTGVGTYTERTITAGANINVTNGSGVAGNPTIAVTGIGTTIEAWDADLDALAALSTTGLVARTGVATYSPRTITGTALDISVTNGDGVAGNPTIDLINAGTPGTYDRVTTDAKGRVTSGVTQFLKGSQAFTFGAIAASSTGTSTNTVTVTGAVSGDIVSLGLDTSGGAAGFMYAGYVSAADTVTIRADNSGTGGTGAGAANATIQVVVTKYANI